jgi:nucleoid DNA-binding protein
MKSIDKRLFISKVSKKLKRTISIPHTNSVINLLCENILKDLEETGKFEIKNLGTFELIKMNPKKYFNVIEQSLKLTKGNKRIKFKLNKKLKKKISNSIDFEKTIGDDNVQDD